MWETTGESSYMASLYISVFNLFEFPRPHRLSLSSSEHKPAAIIVTMASSHLNKETVAVELTEASGTSSPNGTKASDDSISHVAEKYRGTSADKQDMSVLGRKQVLRVGTLSCMAAVHLLIDQAKLQLHYHAWLCIYMRGQLGRYTSV